MGTVVANDLDVVAMEDTLLKIGPFELNSRLIVGSGRYENATMMRQALDLSGSDCITVAIRRERLHDAYGDNLLDHIDFQGSLFYLNRL